MAADVVRLFDVAVLAIGRQMVDELATTAAQNNGERRRWQLCRQGQQGRDIMGQFRDADAVVEQNDF